MSGGSSRPSARDQAAQLRPGTNCRASRASAATWVVEVLLAQPQHFLQPRLVGPHGGIAGRAGELLLEGRPEGPVPVLAERRSQAEIGVAGVLFLADQAGVLEHAEMPRDAGLRQTEDSGQLGHVQPFAVEDAEQPQPGLVAEQTVERGGLTHIYKSTRNDAMAQ